ncbi:MAG: hypothetical protein ACTSQE_13125 [Candidatus Heimdallarchaeaceae archaeon]
MPIRRIKKSIPGTNYVIKGELDNTFSNIRMQIVDAANKPIDLCLSKTENDSIQNTLKQTLLNKVDESLLTKISTEIYYEIQKLKEQQATIKSTTDTKIEQIPEVKKSFFSNKDTTAFSNLD